LLELTDSRSGNKVGWYHQPRTPHDN